MFGIGMSELVVILVIALIVLGPKRLPEVAKALGRGLAEFRKATSDLTDELNDARRAIEDEARAAERQVRQQQQAKAAAPPPPAAVASEAPSPKTAAVDSEAPSSPKTKDEPPGP